MMRKHLGRVKKVLLVLSGKGGVGKSVISATLSAMMADSGLRVGLMDADIYGPSSALLYNAHELPEEGEEGLTPPTRCGVKVMSVDLFAPGKPIPLSGSAAQQVVLELLALTDWGDLDYLVVDMPPATGDIMLSFTSLGMKDVAAVVVSMPDRLSINVAHRVLALLRSGRVQTVGILGNMLRASNSGGLRKLSKEFNVPLLGLLHYDAGVTKAVEESDIDGLLATEFARELGRSMKQLTRSIGWKGGRGQATTRPAIRTEPNKITRAIGS
jgi:ATP-binding protein involved in chromosome partitioning